MLLQIDIGDSGGNGGFANAGRAMQNQLLVLAQAHQERAQQFVASQGSAQAPQRQVSHIGYSCVQGYALGHRSPAMDIYRVVGMISRPV